MDWEKELDQTAFDLCEQEKYTEAAEYAKDYIRVTIQQDLYDLVESGNGAGVYERLRAMYPSDVMNRVLEGVATMDDFFAIATADLFVLMQGQLLLRKSCLRRLKSIKICWGKERFMFIQEQWLFSKNIGIMKWHLLGVVQLLRDVGQL